VASVSAAASPRHAMIPAQACIVHRVGAESGPTRRAARAFITRSGRFAGVANFIFGISPANGDIIKHQNV
jgi:hypothetical protein